MSAAHAVNQRIQQNRRSGFNPLTPTVAICLRYSYKASCARPG